MTLDLSRPAMLDAVINGVKIYIYQRHDGMIYWTYFDFSRFGDEPLRVMRLRRREDWRQIRRAVVKLRRKRDRVR